MISQRTVLSLVQYLALHDRAYVGLIFKKHGLPYSDQVACKELYAQELLDVLSEATAKATEDQIHAVLSEIVRTKNDLRSRVTPRCRHYERFSDLERCLLLDGYTIKGDELVPQDPTILETPSVEDDLTHALKGCGLPDAGAVVQKLADSAEAFRRSPPNYNASLNDARVAIQTLAMSIAITRLPKRPGIFEEKKWGSVLAYLRSSGFINEDEEKGLAGVFGFVSPGSHLPLGLSEMEMARLGRSFVSGMCWFLVKRFMEEHVTT